MAIRRKRRTFHRRKVCRFCVDSELSIDYKDSKTLRYFVTERGKIVPRRISGRLPCCLTRRFTPFKGRWLPLPFSDEDFGWA